MEGGKKFESALMQMVPLIPTDRPVTDPARETSGLLEPADLEYHRRNELKLRADELEEHIRFAPITIEELVAVLKASKLHADNVRKLIEKSGRYKAPF